MLIISLATASAVLTSNTFKKGEDGEPVPEILQKIFFDIIARILFIRVKIDRSHRRQKQLDRSEESDFNNRFASGKRLNKMSPTYESINGLVVKESFSKVRDSYCFGHNSITSSTRGSKCNMSEPVNLILKPNDYGDKKKTSELSQMQKSYEEPHQQRMAKLMKNLSTKLDRYDKDLTKQKRRDEIKNQWIELAKVIDTLLGYIFVFTSIFLLIYLIVKIPNARFM